MSLSGIGNLTLPNSTETIQVNSKGSALVNFETTAVIAHEIEQKQEEEKMLRPGFEPGISDSKGRYA